jgi:hypothetical protein
MREEREEHGSCVGRNEAGESLGSTLEMPRLPLACGVNRCRV